MKVGPRVCPHCPTAPQPFPIGRSLARQDRKYAWEALPDVVADLYNQVDHLLMMLTANNIPDEKYAAVVGEIVADLKRGLREEPMSVHLTSLKDMVCPLRVPVPPG